jgi:hypothetical protein
MGWDNFAKSLKVGSVSRPQREAVFALDAERRVWHAGPLRQGKLSELFTRP